MNPIVPLIFFILLLLCGVALIFAGYSLIRVPINQARIDAEREEAEHPGEYT